MARRHRRTSGPKRLTSWVNGHQENTGVFTANSVVRELALFVPLEDHEGATVIRIVGNVGMFSDDDSVIPVSLAWGIYIAGSGSDGDLQLDPQSALDRESDHWMHLRYVYQNKDFANVTGSNVPMMEYEATVVDIRVMRKVQEGDGIKIVMNAAVDYRSLVNLRVLLKHT